MIDGSARLHASVDRPLLEAHRRLLRATLRLTRAQETHEIITPARVFEDLRPADQEPLLRVHALLLRGAAHPSATRHRRPTCGAAPCPSPALMERKPHHLKNDRT